MRKIDQLLAEYGESHQNHTNKMVHWICVPAIMFSLIGLIWNLPHAFLQNWVQQTGHPWVNWGSLFLVAASLYYVRLSIPLFLGMLFISTAFAWGNVQLHTLGSTAHIFISFGVFAVAWVGQFIGHKIEGKKPSFLKDLQFLLIGPAWLLHFVYQKMGIRW
ncbi:MAG: hypothetical protein C0424_06785 [Sphingobacteriaceae bacterium]|nr:hypothetical protein [Sphingobacteriaceae bacterium]